MIEEMYPNTTENQRDQIVRQNFRKYFRNYVSTSKTMYTFFSSNFELTYITIIHCLGENQC